jgi:sulfite reductase alpha subunit-like flavoprotein
MAADVNKTLENIAVMHGSLTESSAKAWIKRLRNSNRYLEDVWS